MATIGGLQPLEGPPGLDPTGWLPWLNKLRERLNLVFRGKLNCRMVSTVTLTANATSTSLTDERIGQSSFLDFMPTTANAAIAKQTLSVTTRGKGTATLTHASSANTDQTFEVIILA